MNILRRVSFCGVLALFGGLAGGCGGSQNFAPVTNGWKDIHAASRTYRVQPEDTLYSIAFRYGVDYRQLAAANHITAPYHVAVGQKLLLLPGADDTLTTAAAKPGSDENHVVTAGAPVAAVTSQPVTVAAAPAPAAQMPPSSPSAATVAPVATSTASPSLGAVGPVSHWLWPVHGKIIHTFSDAYGGNKGIDIAGSLGQSVRATAAGRIVYCGTGLRGYGLLIIIKHNNDYLSAYAHNNKALVKEGENVKAGQIIALMGSADAARPMLHFEIRRAGKPVNPLDYLK